MRRSRCGSSSTPHTGRTEPDTNSCSQPTSTPQRLASILVFDVMLKEQRAIRLYEALGCQRLGTITHHHSDGLEEPAAVYVAPNRPT